LRLREITQERRMTNQQQFLIRAQQAAKAAGHIFPDYAACEAALESAWGQSKLAVEANNLFGQKQSHPPIGESIQLPTREYAHGAWLTVPAMWTKFVDWPACFAARMALLVRLAKAYPAYAEALLAKDGAAFVVLVSRRWSTDPDRAKKVIEVWQAHRSAFAEIEV
jgi:flagellum-specific peptidoglycan hydrolase FlgJ